MEINQQYIDWVDILNSIPSTKEKTILELGCGAGTKYLIENFKYVHSWETWVDDKWFNYSKADYSQYPNWNGYFKDFKYWGFDITEEDLISSTGFSRDTTALDKYWKEMLNEIDIKTIDVAFVDQGFHLRAETINRFFELEIPYIFYHDSNHGSNLYGWGLINKPNHYTSFNFSAGQGTVLFYK
jgi:hypothetical protein